MKMASKADDLRGRKSHRKTTSQKDNLRKTTSKEENLTGRQPHIEMTSKEDNLKERQLQRTTIKIK